jgi:DNA-binding PadR family transcriptional regulator
MTYSIIDKEVKVMEDMQEIIRNLTLELKRGTLVLGVLSQLRAPQYGYSLVESMAEKNSPIDPGTLYPLLRRLEKQGLLTAEWETSGTKPRKYYMLSAAGEEVYATLREEWENLQISVKNLIGWGEN